MSDREDHNRCTHRFIELANQLKNDGIEPQVVSAALMSASGIYVTFVAAGNNGALEPTGVDKAVEMYRNNLQYIQTRKREHLEEQEKQSSGE